MIALKLRKSKYHFFRWKVKNIGATFEQRCGVFEEELLIAEGDYFECNNFIQLVKDSSGYRTSFITLNELKAFLKEVGGKQETFGTCLGDLLKI